MALNIIQGGAFQDFEGNRLAYGYLTMQLSHDEQYSVTPAQIVAGFFRRIPLDENGNIAGTVLVYATDALNPAGAFYIVNAFRVDGTQAWLNPQYLQVPSSPNPYNVGNWIPTNPVGGGSGASVGSLLLQTNGINNQSQEILNQKSTDGSVIITDLGSGNINFQASVTPFGPRPSFGNWHYTSGVVASLNSSGASIGMSMSGGTSLTNATATEPSYTTATTTASTNQYQVMYDLVYEANLSLMSDWQVRAKLGTTSNCRYWIAMTDNNSIGGGQLVATLPPCAVVGFRYVFGVDTNWQCYCSPSGGATHTLVDSGVAPSTTAGHIFEARPISSGATVQFYIDSVLVGTISTTLPTATTLLSLATNVDNVPGGGSAATSLLVAYWYWESSK